MSPEEMDKSLRDKMDKLLTRAGRTQLRQHQNLARIAEQRRLLDSRRIGLVGTRLIARASQDPTAHAALSAIVAEAGAADALAGWVVPALVTVPATVTASPASAGDGSRRPAPGTNAAASRASDRHQAGPERSGSLSSIGGAVGGEPDLLSGGAA